MAHLDLPALCRGQASRRPQRGALSCGDLQVVQQILKASLFHPHRTSGSRELLTPPLCRWVTEQRLVDVTALSVEKAWGQASPSGLTAHSGHLCVDQPLQQKLRPQCQGLFSPKWSSWESPVNHTAWGHCLTCSLLAVGTPVLISPNPSTQHGE